MRAPPSRNRGAQLRHGVLSLLVACGPNAEPEPADEVEDTEVSGNTEVLAARIVPDPVHADDAVSVEVDASDPDGPPELTVRWWVNRVLVAEGPSLALPSGAGFTRGDVLEVQVEGTGARGSPAADEAVVVNSPPRVDVPVILPGVVRAADPVTAVTSVTDVDGDLLSVWWRWTRVRGGDVEESPLAVQPALPFEVRRGDRLQASVEASDSVVSTSAVSAELTVANTPPAIGRVQVGDGSGEASPWEALRCKVEGGLVGGGFDLDGDEVSLAFTWDNRGVLMNPGLATTTEHPGDTLPVGVHQAGDAWTCTVVVSDGVDNTVVVSETTAVPCKLPLLASHPAEGALNVSTRSVVTVAFSEDLSEDVTVSLVSRATGEEHPMLDPVWSADGRNVWIGPAVPLSPSVFYEVHLASACGVTRRGFETGVGDGPQVEPADLLGKAWAVLFGSGVKVLEPRGLDAFARSMIQALDVRLVVIPTGGDVATSTLTVEVGARMPNFKQETCSPTTSFAGADASALPFVVLDRPGLTVFPSLADNVRLHDLHVQGHLIRRANQVEYAHFRAVVDLESAEHTIESFLGQQLGALAAEEACARIADLGAEEACVPCPDHGRPTCLRVFLDDLSLAGLASPFEAVSEADVAADPLCAGTQPPHCACASTDPRAGIGALALLALGLRRRRR